MMKYVTFLLAMLILVGCTVCPPCPPCETPTPGPGPTATATVTPDSGVLWEPFLSSINAKYERVEGARYRLVAVFHTANGQWTNPDGSWAVPDYAVPYVKVNGGGGETHMFGIIYQKDGSPLVGKNVILSWPDGQVGGVTWQDGSVSFFTNASYAPDRGEVGPYSLQPLNADRLIGGGLPYNLHVSIFGVWREDPNWSPTLMERFRAFILGGKL